ncbi:MAG: glycosyltransferase family 4 protein [Bacteroidales bacterium]|nr:glycosyltransferase family 4 protein [Bacteroidales bacterium]MBD5208426.1 glycosyltransferase family 4 protein [Bacteroidales bacterium]
MIYVIVTILLIFLELGYFRLADKYNIIDKPNLRSSHSSITLRGGGVIFLLGAWLFWVLFGFQYSWFMAGLTIIGAVSFVDDIRSIAGKWRLLAQFTSVLLMLRQFGELISPEWWVVIIALIVCVGIINAYNFMDGINGITGGYSLAVLLPMIYLNLRLDFISMPFLIITGLSLLVFCFFNFRKRAKCFAGDVGSISIAYILLFSLGTLILVTDDISYIVFLAVYGVDVVMTILHRMMLHDNLGRAHRKHAYQLMVNELKLPHLAVAAGYMGLQLIISAGRIFLPVNPNLYLGCVLLVLIVGYVVFMKKNYHLHAEYLKTKNYEDR